MAAGRGGLRCGSTVGMAVSWLCEVAESQFALILLEVVTVSLTSKSRLSALISCFRVVVVTALLLTTSALSGAASDVAADSAHARKQAAKWGGKLTATKQASTTVRLKVSRPMRNWRKGSLIVTAKLTDGRNATLRRARIKSKLRSSKPLNVTVRPSQAVEWISVHVQRRGKKTKRLLGTFKVVDIRGSDGDSVPPCDDCDPVPPCDDCDPVPPKPDNDPVLNIDVSGGGQGVISSVPEGISCSDVEGSGTCEKSFKEGTVVTLTATPASGSDFYDWDRTCMAPHRNTCRITLRNSQQTVRARFVRSGTGTGRNCLAYAYDPAVGYELCSHWFTDSTFPYLEGKGVSGGTVRTEAWREGPTWDSVNNTVYLRATLTIQSRTAVNISLTAAVCGDPQFRPCVDAQQVETIALAAGSNSIVRTYKLTPYRAPLKSQIILVDDLASAIFIGGSAFLGCRGNIDICGI
jgi:hypothetical protein